MRPIKFLLTCFWVFTFLGAAPSIAAKDLILKRVLLSTGGVGYFEYEAEVDGNANLSLQVRLDQVDDVLKSVVVYDDTGQVGAISLPGKTPLQDVFREMPFGQDALDSPVALLNTLRGAEVAVKGARALKGRILSIKPETATLAGDRGTITRHRLSLMTAAGIRQLVLEDTDQLEFSDPGLQADINRALKALAELGQRDRRTLRVTVAGTGSRTIRVAYLVEAPLWKTSYRLTMPDDPFAAASDLQGWAMVENRSGEDWTDVELTLVSGNPVTFRQALYDTYYVNRTEVPVEVLGRLLPRSDDGSMPAEIMAEATEPKRKSDKARARRQSNESQSLALAAPMMADAGRAAGGVPDAAQTLASESSEATSYVLFRHPAPVSVANGFSLSIPFVGRTFEAERLALYQPETHATHPLAAIRLTNDSDTALPPGILTLYERSADSRVAYVGDARMKTVPADNNRLLSYALDQNIRIEREETSDNRIATAKIANGLLVLSQRRRMETHYRIKGPIDEGRNLVIEHPRIPGWDLADPAVDGVEVTSTHYRIARRLEAGAPVSLRVALERTERQTVSLSTMRPDQIRFYASARELQPALRKAIAALAEKLKAIEDADSVVAKLERDRQELISEQGRLSDTLRSIPKESDLFQRYLKSMTENEDNIETVKQSLGKARNSAAAAQKAMLDYVRSLKL